MVFGGVRIPPGLAQVRGARQELDMNWRRLIWRTPGWIALGGVVWVNGCLAALEHNVDILMAPNALENALVASYSPVRNLLDFLIRWVY